MNKALIDSDIYSEVLKAINQTVVHHAVRYRQSYGILTISAITVMECIQGLQKVGASNRIQRFRKMIALGGSPAFRSGQCRSSRPDCRWSGSRWPADWTM